VNLRNRNSNLLIREIDLLREAVRATRVRHPFHIDAWVVLPEHMHCRWTLPPGDANFAVRWKVIKFAFAKRLPITEVRTVNQQRRRERTIGDRPRLTAALSSPYLLVSPLGELLDSLRSPFGPACGCYSAPLRISLLAQKVTKEKARPASGFRCAQRPAPLAQAPLRGSARRAVVARHASFGIDAKRPSPQHLRSAS
jgi:REP element-mobilizing transposase RayT